ncbi:acyl-CoA dehydrogenase family protein [Reinekea blandensis]|uniref:3-sulfinopropanoyl-CoA desulfinase n=1 Tax=Reinekea blandensis MED297 TaxID=314283 RepID=A4B8U0_9GAMM|nr:acyl-CoA dehydrogenase family protein [Reinekea blandensis]EAR11041.1 putative acyl CoA dehydrogenase oxidoreductase protein [Reinekea sp. MED297] [Reinekea blandensis MED297]
MSELNDIQVMMRDAARDFAQNELKPNSAKWDRSAEHPIDIIKQLGETGFYGLTVPEAYGGSEAGYLSLALVVEEIAQGDGALSTITSVMNSVVCSPIAAYGSEAQKTQWLPALANGEKLGAFCLTEPHAGSDAAALKTRAVRTSTGWRLNGTKQFITNGAIADLAIVFAVTDPDKGKKGLSAFLVPAHLPGFEVPVVESKMGQRASDTAQLVFKDIELPEDALLGAEGQGYAIALGNLEGGRIGIAAQCVGMAQAAFDVAASYAQERESFGTRLMDHQAVAFRLADMDTQIEAARQLVWNAARRKDAGLPALREAAMAKLFASDMAEKVVSDAMQTLGGYGYLTDFPIEQIYRDVRVARIYEGTSDIQKMIIARDIEGRFS